jgi:hypothetical protein
MYNKSLHTQFSTPDMVRSPFCSTVRSLSGYTFSLWTPGRLRHCAAVHGDLWWRFGALHTGDGVLPKHPGRIFEIHWSTGVVQTSESLHVFTSSMPSLGGLVEWFVTNHGLYICPPGSTWPRQSFSTGAQRDVAKYGQGTDIQATATNARLAWTSLSRFLVSTWAIPVGPWCWRLTHHDERRPGWPSIFGIWNGHFRFTKVGTRTTSELKYTVLYKYIFFHVFSPRH